MTLNPDHFACVFFHELVSRFQGRRHSLVLLQVFWDPLLAVFFLLFPCVEELLLGDFSERLLLALPLLPVAERLLGLGVELGRFAGVVRLHIDVDDLS